MTENKWSIWQDQEIQLQFFGMLSSLLSSLYVTISSSLYARSRLVQHKLITKIGYLMAMVVSSFSRNVTFSAYFMHIESSVSWTWHDTNHTILPFVSDWPEKTAVFVLLLFLFGESVCCSFFFTSFDMYTCFSKPPFSTHKKLHNHLIYAEASVLFW